MTAQEEERTLTHRDPTNSPTHKAEAVRTLIDTRYAELQRINDGYRSHQQLLRNCAEMHFLDKLRAALAEDRPDREGVGERKHPGFGTSGCNCHHMTFCPDLEFSHYDEDQPVFKWKAATPDTAPKEAAEAVAWRRVNDEPFEYAIQQGPHGDAFVTLLNGTCLRRPLPPPRSSALPAGGSSGHIDGEVK